MGILIYLFNISYTDHRHGLHAVHWQVADLSITVRRGVFYLNSMAWFPYLAGVLVKGYGWCTDRVRRPTAAEPGQRVAPAPYRSLRRLGLGCWALLASKLFKNCKTPAQHEHTFIFTWMLYRPAPRQHQYFVQFMLSIKHFIWCWFGSLGPSILNLVSNLIHDIADLKELLISDTYRLPFIVKRY